MTIITILERVTKRYARALFIWSGGNPGLTVKPVPSGNTRKRYSGGGGKRCWSRGRGPRAFVSSEPDASRVGPFRLSRARTVSTHAVTGGRVKQCSARRGRGWVDGRGQRVDCNHHARLSLFSRRRKRWTCGTTRCGTTGTAPARRRHRENRTNGARGPVGWCCRGRSWTCRWNGPSRGFSRGPRPRTRAYCTTVSVRDGPVRIRPYRRIPSRRPLDKTVQIVLRVLFVGPNLFTWRWNPFVGNGCRRPRVQTPFPRRGRSADGFLTIAENEHV